MLDWQTCQICYRLEIKLLLLLLQILVGLLYSRCEICVFIFYLRLRSSLYSQIMRLDMTYRIGNQSINLHQINQSINQSINKSINQSISQSVGQSVSQSINLIVVNVKNSLGVRHSFLCNNLL